MLERLEDSTSAPIAAAEIDQSPPGDREEPAPKRRLIPLEAIEPRGDIEPYLGGEILAVRWRLGSKVAEQTRLNVPVEGGDCPFGPGPRLGENAFERIPHRQTRIMNV